MAKPGITITIDSDYTFGDYGWKARFKSEAGVEVSETGFAGTMEEAKERASAAVERLKPYRRLLRSFEDRP